MVFFGDGASNEGIFHEALNMASIWKLPVVFVLENNQFGLSTRITDVAAIDRFSRRAASYSMPGETIDGNDVIAVYDTVSRAASRARNGQGPGSAPCRARGVPRPGASGRRPWRCSGRGHGDG